MRLLLVAEHLRRPVAGGIGTYTRGLLAGLAQLGSDGPEVTLLAGRRGRRRLPDPVAALGLPVVASPVPGRLLTRLWNRGWPKAPAGFDVVHAPSLASPPTQRPLTVMVHDVAWREVPDAFPRRGRRWHDAALGRAIERAAALVVPSEATAKAVVAAGADPDRVTVIEEGSDHLPAGDGPGARAVLDGAGVTGEYLLTVGTAEPRKNLARLIEAYGRARPDLPEPWPLVVVGPKGWGEQVPLDGRPGIVAAGTVSDAVLAALYEGARCLAYVPLTEGFGLPAVEAMRAGTVVVASPIPSTGGAALEADPVDVASIAGALVVATADDATRARLLQAGRRRAEQLTWAETARRHMQLWSRLARER